MGGRVCPVRFGGHVVITELLLRVKVSAGAVPARVGRQVVAAVHGSIANYPAMIPKLTPTLIAFSKERSPNVGHFDFDTDWLMSWHMS